MFKTRDFLPVIITVLVVFILAIVALAQTNECANDWTCWFVAPLRIMFGQFQSTHTGSPGSQFLLVLTQVGGKAILLVGAFLSSVRLVVSAVRHDFRTARARRMKNHTIVCGLGETGMQVVQNSRAAGQDIVVIDRADDSVNAAACDRLGIPLIRGDATNSDMLALAGVLRAGTIIVCTGDDVSNIDVALNIKELVRNRQQTGARELLVLAEMRTQWLFSRLVNHNQYSLGSGSVELRLFNTNENAARLLLRSLRLPPGPEISSGAFVVFGFGPLGQQVTLHMIRAAPATIGSKAKIIVFDQAAEQRQREFSQTYPQAAKLADVAFFEANISTDHHETWISVENIVRDQPLLGIAVCFQDDQTSLYAGISMRRVLDDLSRIHVPLFLRLGQYRHLGLFAATMETLQGQPERFQIFGGLEELLGSDILIHGELDNLAKAFHAQYRDSRETIGQFASADKPWNMLPETLKMSNRRRADNLPFLLAQVGLKMKPSTAPTLLELKSDEIELLARLEHRRWMIERQLLGFSYGEVRSDFPPRHDLLVDWDQLPEAERDRNRKDFVNLPKILALVNFEIWRERKILAVERQFDAALSDLESAVVSKSPRCVVIADVDSADGRKAAELALKLPEPSLWLLSSNYPLEFQWLQQLRKVFESAAGWITREQVHAENQLE
jgi:voltage-gated potassium channel Kch